MNKVVKVSLVLSLSAFLLISFAVFFASGGDDPKGIDMTIVSENKKSVATGYRLSGGGGAGWCVFEVDVLDLTQSSFFGYKPIKVFESESCEDGYGLTWADEESSTLKISCPKSDYDYKNFKLDSANGLKVIYENCG